MIDFDKALSELPKQTILCIGDLMLDEFVYGDVARISPEAPTPVIAAKRSESVIGGAGNVARNIAALGARCVFVSVVGQDAAGEQVTKALAADPLIQSCLVVDASRPTTRKMRFVSERYSTHLLRADWEETKPASSEHEQALIDYVLAALPKVGAVILSDYAKGVLTPKVIAAVLEAAKRAGKPAIVDPKILDFSVYRGAAVIAPNRKELMGATRRELLGNAEVESAASEAMAQAQSEAILVKRSEDGMTLAARGKPPVHIAAYPVKVRDVSGAGDTVVAVFAAMLAAKADFETAMRAANAAAAVVVGKRGTATASLAELRARLLPAASLAMEEKVVFDWKVLDERLAEWRRQGLRVGFTNGCFDLLHPGHVRLLTQARATCDRLILGLNSDASVARLKGEGRPVQNEQARAEVLAALEAVDLVVIFGEDTPLQLIERVRPSVLVKGADYTREQVVGHEVVEAHGGEVVLIELVPGHSTTAIVRRSKSADRR